MKSKDRANLERYGTDEHIAGIGMSIEQIAQSPAAQVKPFLCGESVRQSTEKIIKVTPCDEGYLIMTDHKTGFVINTRLTDVIPAVGDSVTLYTIQISVVVGVELNSKLLYFLSEKDL